MYSDTIVAISTPVGEGGIGIVRLSGERAAEIARKVFDRQIIPWRLAHGHIVDPEDAEVIDEVLVSFMPVPHSYTREDVVEINCHGGAAPLQRILELCLRSGARLAQPGEFTLRAFLKGRIDLAQAEAVQDVIQARTRAGLRLAMQCLSGKLSKEIKAIREELLPCLANLTARIDFPEDEVEEMDLAAPLEEALHRMEELVRSAATGIVFRQGLRTAIVGRPNVGKSSLLNILLGQDRAIVTPVPGTTRDTLEETLSIQGVPFVLIDTAGIARSGNMVETLGIERSRRAIEMADLVLMVVDISSPVTPEDREIFDLLGSKEVVLAGNKSDLPTRAELLGLPWVPVGVSALTGAGIGDLREAMVRVALGGRVVASDALMVGNPRHKEALDRAREFVARVLAGLRTGIPDDLIATDLTAALEALGEITGETVQEDLLDAIFSRFCIGK